MSTSREQSEQRIGSTIDRKWRLDAMIGYSSVATTYRATHRNGHEAALKIIHASHGSFAALVDRFLQEAHLANLVDHPGVERVFDDGHTEDGCVFLVMELLEGETLELRRMSAGGSLSLRSARPIFDGLLDALTAVHDAGVVHRNLKPGNVFLTKDGRVVLTDFGRARLSDRDLQSPLTIEGMVMGTPAYMPPEQARGLRSELDAQSDVWSAGAILFTTLAGRRVHEAATADERLSMAASRHAPRIAAVLPEIERGLAGVIDQALSFDKKNRWATAAEMRRAYWLATGRDIAKLQSNQRGKTRKPAARPEAPPGGWEAIAWPTDGATPGLQTAPDPALLPPPLAPFLKAEESSAVLQGVKARRRIRWLRGFGFFVLVLAIGAAVTGVIVLHYSDDKPRKAPGLDAGR